MYAFSITVAGRLDGKSLNFTFYNMNHMAFEFKNAVNEMEDYVDYPVIAENRSEMLLLGISLVIVNAANSNQSRFITSSQNVDQMPKGILL